MIEHVFSEFLGELRGFSPEKKQIKFDCPECSSSKGLTNGDGKGKLEINYGLGVYNCWVCGESHNTKGNINKLIRKYGNKKTFEYFKEFNFELNVGVKLVESTLPKIEGLHKFNNNKRLEKKDYFFKKKALDYLHQRGLTDEMIHEYDMGFTTQDSKFFNRIVIPSYDSFGNLSYYVGRTIFNKVKPKYLLPEYDKTTLMFNENRVNWYSDIYLVEGVFDHMVIPNSIPLLGKVLYDYLYELIYYNAKANVYIMLDNDAYKNSKIIYDKLNNGVLSGRIKEILLNSDDDIFDVYMKKGLDEVITLFN